MGKGTTRIGGLFGIASAIAVIPAYVVGSPEVPAKAEEARSYFDEASTFLHLNGTLALLHVLFGLVFVGVLVSVLRSAAGPTGAVYVVLLGGAVLFALTAAGLAAEVAVPQAIVRFQDVSVTNYSQPFLGLAVWLYHFSQMGSAAMIFATAHLAWRTGALPRWSAALVILGVPAILHVFIGLPGAYATVAWLGLTGLSMLVLPTSANAATDDTP